MRATAFWSAAILIVISTGAAAQDKPDFSGTWVLDWTSIPVPPGATGPGTGPGRGAPAGGSLGEEFAATQTRTTLTVEYVRGTTPVKLVYELDGSENRNMLAGRNGPVEQLSTAVWKGRTLVITTVTRFGRQIRALSLAGDHLVLAIEQPIPEGPPIVSKIRYRKR